MHSIRFLTLKQFYLDAYDWKIQFFSEGYMEMNELINLYQYLPNIEHTILFRIQWVMLFMIYIMVFHTEQSSNDLIVLSNLCLVVRLKTLLKSKDVILFY